MHLPFTLPTFIADMPKLITILECAWIRNCLQGCRDDLMSLQLLKGEVAYNQATSMSLSMNWPTSAV